MLSWWGEYYRKAWVGQTRPFLAHDGSGEYYQRLLWLDGSTYSLDANEKAPASHRLDAVVPSQGSEEA